jgi:hypothetical protein
MNKYLIASSVALMTALLSFAAYAAAPSPDTNWGQQVKDCNLTSCYPGGTNRGTYVQGQATDTQGPGYGYEIQTLAPVPSSDNVPFK